ncbi:MAG: two-component response regulator [Candidatus Scalindua rubra]|uniref:Two-component response regulator n=1 Tax=Candidatus Scalindua rubra TaxID=1872076 RepID=A0A1E3X3X2_9BACT|nr:MAG: two-component response regulator [Candidatus Scalindua rubra]
MEEKVENAEDVIVIIAEDDEGHASLIIKNLNRARAMNNFLRFKDGQEVLDFLFMRGKGPHRESGKAYLLLLDIRMPKVDGVEVLRQIKEDPELSKMPVIMLTTTDDSREIEKCHKLGCNVYVTKPVDYDNFTDAMKKLGFFLTAVRVPRTNG